MFRKVVTGLALLAVGSYLWMGTSLGSYARTGAAQAIGFCRGQVPVEFEIKRARQLLSELVPNINKTMTSIVTEEVKVGRLNQEIVQIEKNLASEQVALMALRDQLSKGLASYRIGSETFAARDLQTELNRRFNGYKRVDASLQAKRQMLEARQCSVRAAREKYDALVASKDRLESEVASLESRHLMNQAKSSANRFQIDDSQLSRINQLIGEIDERLTVESRLAEEEGNLMKRVPVDEIVPSNLGEQIDQYFEKTEETPKTTASL